MPAPRHVRMTVSGTLGTNTPAPEIWSINLSATPGTLDGASDNAILGSLGAVATQVKTAFGTRLGPRLSSVVRVTRTRAALVNADGRIGRTVAGQYRQADDLGPIQCTGADNGHPFQVACVVRQDSNFAGPTGRGRFFLPLPAALAVAADGLMDVVSANLLATVSRQFLDDVNAATTAAWAGVVCVASAGSPTRGLPPALHPVRRVKVGRAFDTMRSRRSDLVEAYRTEELAVV